MLITAKKSCPKIGIDFWGNWQVACQTRRRAFLRWSPPPLSPFMKPSPFIPLFWGQIWNLSPQGDRGRIRWRAKMRRQRSMAGKSPVC